MRTDINYVVVCNCCGIPLSIPLSYPDLLPEENRIRISNYELVNYCYVKDAAADPDNVGCCGPREGNKPNICCKRRRTVGRIIDDCIGPRYTWFIATAVSVRPDEFGFYKYAAENFTESKEDSFLEGFYYLLFTNDIEGARQWIEENKELANPES